MDAIDVSILADAIIKEFDLEDIDFSKIMEWQRVKDVVRYIEDVSEDNQEPYISNFEVEA